MRIKFTNPTYLPILYFLFLAFLSCNSEERTPVLLLSTNSLDFDINNSSATFDITNSGDDELTWDIDVSNESISLNKTSGSDNSQIQVSVDFQKYGLGDFTETLTIMSNAGNQSIQLNIISKNITGVWTGIYQWSCTADLSGERSITYEIQDNLNGTFDGQVISNAATSDFIDGIVEFDEDWIPDDQIYVYIFYPGVPGSFVDNDFEGYITIEDKQMEGVTTNGDSPAIPGETEGCSADQGPTGTVTASLTN